MDRLSQAECIAQIEARAPSILGRSTRRLWRLSGQCFGDWRLTAKSLPANMSRSIRDADFATGERGGDVVSLCAYLEGCTQGEAARRLAMMLGVETRGRR
jgi:hypothetical protein